MKTQHTPGPWFRGCNSPVGVQIVTADKNDEPNALIAVVNHNVVNPKQETSDEVRANALLISAAPEMLAALKQAEIVLAVALCWPGSEDTKRKIRAAIDRAEPRSS